MSCCRYYTTDGTTDVNIELEGWKAIGRALATNSTITTLHVGGKLLGWSWRTRSVCVVLSTSTGNNINYQGGTAICHSLATNFTLTALDLSGAVAMF